MKKKRKIEKKKITRKGFRIPLDLLIIALLFPLFALLMLTMKKPIAVKIPSENVQETSYWKTYQNNDFFFSFKYPDYILSNFQVETFNNTYQKVKGIAHAKTESENGIPTYNVFFEANAWKFTGTLDDFVKKGPLKISSLKTQEIILEENHGVRVTNVDLEKQEGYFYYNLFKKDDYIYNFALLSDDKVLIDANSSLLDKIMSTAKFYPTP